MNEHELKVHHKVTYFIGECPCGWELRRSRLRDLRRAFVKHITDHRLQYLQEGVSIVVKPAMEE